MLISVRSKYFLKPLCVTVDFLSASLQSTNRIQLFFKTFKMKRQVDLILKNANMKWCIVYDDLTKIKEHLTFCPIRCIFISICLKYTRSEYKQHVIKYEKTKCTASYSNDSTLCMRSFIKSELTL